MDRITWAAEVIRNSGSAVRSLLDVGCRDQILRQTLSQGPNAPELDYRGLDLEQNAAGTVDYVGDVASIEFDRRFDCVVALDVLEHTDQPQLLFDQLLDLADHSLVITLPNCSDLKGRLKFLLRGSLGGKYHFTAEPTLDRHRWVMNAPEIRAFFRDKAEEHRTDCSITPIWYGELGTKRPSAWAGFALRGLGQGLSASAFGAVFVKQPEPVLIPKTATTSARDSLDTTAATPTTTRESVQA